MDLLPLDDYNRKASLGREYNELKNIYDNWSHDLHAKGNFIDNENLKTISVNGLIRWYFKNLIYFNIDYNYQNMETFINNPQNLTFYDIKSIIRLAKYFNINNDFITRLELEKHNYKYEFLLLNFKYSFINRNQYNKEQLNKYCNLSFGNFLIDNMGIDVLKKYLININTEYLKYKDFFEGKNTL